MKSGERRRFVFVPAEELDATVAFPDGVSPDRVEHVTRILPPDRRPSVWARVPADWLCVPRTEQRLAGLHGRAGFHDHVYRSATSGRM